MIRAADSWTYVPSMRFILMLLALPAAACGTSDSQVQDTRNSGGTQSSESNGGGGSNVSDRSNPSGGSASPVGTLASGGSSLVTGGSGGSSLVTDGSGGSGTVATSSDGGATSGTGSSGGTGGLAGSTGASGTATSSGGCPSDTTLTIGARVAFEVTWDGTTAGSASSGKQTAQIRWLGKYTVDGNKLTGTYQNCSLSLPDMQLNAIGALAAGGTKVQIEIPSSVWAKPSMPRFVGSATMSGWDPPATFASNNEHVTLVGIALPSSADPETLKWPSSAWSFPSGTKFEDSDGDSKPGVTAIPRSGGDYVYPPTEVGIGGLAPAADEVFIVSRNRVAFTGKWTSCTELSGTATVTIFDNHVVGCHIHDGSNCTTDKANTEADFVDQNRTVYNPGAASFAAQKLKNDATCTDVLAALP